MSILALWLATSAPAADRQDWEQVYDRAATTGLISGIAGPVVPPLATAAVYAVYKKRFGPPPNVFDRCHGPGAVLCVLLFPVLIPAQVVATLIWFAAPIALSVAYTGPLYGVGPPLIAGSAMRGRRALVELGVDTPGTWGTTAWVMVGMQGGGLVVALAGQGAGDGPVAAGALMMLGGWAGACTAGLLQWRVNSKHRKVVAPADAPTAARAAPTLPLFQVGGHW